MEIQNSKLFVSNHDSLQIKRQIMMVRINYDNFHLKSTFLINQLYYVFPESTSTSTKLLNLKNYKQLIFKNLQHTYTIKIYNTSQHILYLFRIEQIE